MTVPDRHRAILQPAVVFVESDPLAFAAVAVNAENVAFACGHLASGAGRARLAGIRGMQDLHADVRTAGGRARCHLRPRVTGELAVTPEQRENRPGHPRLPGAVVSLNGGGLPPQVPHDMAVVRVPIPAPGALAPIGH